MEKSELIAKLNTATDKAAIIATTRGELLPKKAVLVGKAYVQKNKHNLYDVVPLDMSCLYRNITVFDVAVIVAQKYSSDEKNVIKQILRLEEKFSKQHNDMLHYLHCIRGAKKSKDFEKMAILEDRFQYAEIIAKNLRDRISVFKRTK